MNTRMKQHAGTAVSYVLDQGQRRARKLVRPVRIAKGYAEYVERRALITPVRPGDDDDLRLLKSRGHVDVSLDEGLSRALIAASRQKLAISQSLPQHSSKAFFSPLLTDDDRRVGEIYMRVALSEPMLRLVGSYLGTAPFLESVDLLLSRPVGNGAPTQSQLWHRDRTDAAIMKLFVYINDVRAEHGPFIFLSKEESSKVPDYLPHYVADNVMERHVPLSQAVTIEGDAGTAFLIDTTNCYHLGSRCDEPRLAYVAYYSSGFGYFPRQHSWRVEPDEKSKLSAMQRLALGQHPGA